MRTNGKEKNGNYVNVAAGKYDPDTSKKAAEELRLEQLRAQRSVLIAVQIIRDYGPMTDFVLADYWSDYWGTEKYSHSLPNKARHWAREAGLVKLCGKGKHLGRDVNMYCLGVDTEWLARRDTCPCCGQIIQKSDSDLEDEEFRNILGIIR